MLAGSVACMPHRVVNAPCLRGRWLQYVLAFGWMCVAPMVRAAQVKTRRQAGWSDATGQFGSGAGHGFRESGGVIAVQWRCLSRPAF